MIVKQLTLQHVMRTGCVGELLSSKLHCLYRMNYLIEGIQTVEHVVSWWLKDWLRELPGVVEEIVDLFCD
jgi:integral membrane sensor domain MASE1